MWKICMNISVYILAQKYNLTTLTQVIVCVRAENTLNHAYLFYLWIVCCYFCTTCLTMSTYKARKTIALKWNAFHFHNLNICHNVLLMHLISWWWWQWDSCIHHIFGYCMYRWRCNSSILLERLAFASSNGHWRKWPAN